jgi:hypothetical protein
MNIMTGERQRFRIGLKGRNQLPLIMMWWEIWNGNELVYAYPVATCDTISDLLNWRWRQ